MRRAPAWTGPVALTIQVGPELEAKRLELLRETLPGVSRVAYLGSKEDEDWESPWGKSVRTAAQTLGVTLVPAEFTRHQYTHAFTLISRARADALFVGPNPATYNDRAHRGLRGPDSAAKHLRQSGVGGSRGFDVLWREQS